MKAGTENRNKTIAASVLGACALIGVVYMMYTFFGGDSAPKPPPTIAPLTRNFNQTSDTLAKTENRTKPGGVNSRPAGLPSGNTAGVAAKKLATTSASLDPTLDQSAMLRAEHMVYAGTGRNIFSAVYTPPVAKIEAPKFPARPTAPVYVAPQPTGPPPPPPINLKFFGTATRANGSRQAFLLQGDEVFLASQGDIVARRYKIVSISANSLQVQDMVNSNTQTLPLQSN